MGIDLDDRYIFDITDDTGMFQHAVSGIPDPSEGYTTDDNARALIAAEMLYIRSPEKKYADLMRKYMGFMLYAQKDRWFRNFMGYDRRFLEKRGSEDCFGRCICALGFTMAQNGLPQSVYDCAGKLLRHTYSSCSSLSYLKGKAYAAIGLALWGCADAHPAADMLGGSLVDAYTQHDSESWHWFKDKVTYCSAVLPLALFMLHEKTGKKEYLKVGLESLCFLLKWTMADGYFKPVGCSGWFEKGGKPAEYDGQPVEPCGMMLACLKACALTGKSEYRDFAKKAFMWYHGQNIAGINMIDSETGGCRDGILKSGVNKNEGAESIVCYIISSIAAENASLFD